MRNEGGEWAVLSGVLSKNLELLRLQVGLTADPLAQGRDTAERFQLHLAELAPFRHQFLPLCSLRH